MISSNSFGTNIEKIIQEILVTRTKVDELLMEIRNMSTDQINNCNDLVTKLLSILQIIDERTKDIEKNYAKLISEKNRFIDLTEWNETVLPEIVDIFEEELSGYLTKVLSIEDICERFLVEQLENYKAEQNDNYELTHNVFKKDPYNEERMKKYVYGESIGYNWYSVKAQDDYLANDNSLLVVTKYDDDKWSELNSIYKGAVLHETISFHPKYGSLHIVTNARERVVSSYVDQELNTSMYTNDIKLFDGFDGNFNELKGSLYNRNITRDNRNNMKEKNDIKYSLTMRHKINDRDEPLEPNDYFILKVRDIEPLHEGRPNNYVIQRINTTIDNITTDYTDETTKFKALSQNPLDASSDKYMSETNSIVKNLEDNDENITLNKRIVKINKYNYFDNNLIMNISADGLLMLLKYQYNNRTPRVYNDLAVYSLTNNFKFNIKNEYKKIENYDLLSNLVLKIMPPNYTNFTNTISYLNELPSIEDKGIMKTFESFQITNTSNYGFIDKLHAQELNIYYKEPNTNLKLPNGTLLDRLINDKGNKQYHLLNRYNIQEYYDIYNMPLRYNNLYFFPYMRDVSQTNLQSTLLTKYNGLYDSYKSQSYRHVTETENANNRLGGFTNTNIEWGIYTRNWSNVCKFSNMTDDGHVIQFRRYLYNTSYSDNYGKTWNHSKLDLANSAIKDYELVYPDNAGEMMGEQYAGLWLNDNGLVVMALRYNGTEAGNRSIYFKSSDFGKTWTIGIIDANINKTGQCIAAFCNRDGIIVATEGNNNGGRVYISPDFGKTWKYFIAKHKDSSRYETVHIYNATLTNYCSRAKGYLLRLDGEGKDVQRSQTRYGFTSHFVPITKEWIDNLTNGTELLYESLTNSFTSEREAGYLYSNVLQMGPDVFINGYYTCTKSNAARFKIHDTYGYWSGSSLITNESREFGLGSKFKLPARGSVKITKSGLVFYQEGYESGARIWMVLDPFSGDNYNTSTTNLYPTNGGASDFSVNEKHKMLMYSIEHPSSHARLVKFNWKKPNIAEESSYVVSLNQKMGLIANLTTTDVDEIKEEVIKRILSYYEKQSNIYVGTLIQLPFKFDSSSKYYNKYKLCDGSILSKTEYPELYKVIGDLYNTEDVEPGYFRLPDYREQTFVGTDSPDLIGSKIYNCLPENMEFEIQFNRIDEQDMRSGVIVSETESSNTRTTVLGGFENGMDRTLFSIDHASRSQKTIGNMFSVDVYIRVK